MAQYSESLQQIEEKLEAKMEKMFNKKMLALNSSQNLAQNEQGMVEPLPQKHEENIDQEIRTMAMLIQFRRDISKLKDSLEDGFEKDNIFVLIPKKQSWKDQMDSIREIYLKLCFGLVKEYILEEYEEIKKEYNLAYFAINEKISSPKEQKEADWKNELPEVISNEVLSDSTTPVTITRDTTDVTGATAANNERLFSCHTCSLPYIQDYNQHMETQKKEEATKEDTATTTTSTGTAIHKNTYNTEGVNDSSAKLYTPALMIEIAQQEDNELHHHNNDINVLPKQKQQQPTTIVGITEADTHSIPDKMPCDNYDAADTVTTTSTSSGCISDGITSEAGTVDGINSNITRPGNENGIIVFTSGEISLELEFKNKSKFSNNFHAYLAKALNIQRLWRHMINWKYRRKST